MRSSVTFRHLTIWAKSRKIRNHRKIHYIVPPKLAWTAVKTEPVSCTLTRDSSVSNFPSQESYREEKARFAWEFQSRDAIRCVHTVNLISQLLCGATTPAWAILQVLISPLPLPPQAFFCKCLLANSWIPENNMPPRKDLSDLLNQGDTQCQSGAKSVLHLKSGQGE